jgi:hypothetical protein
MLRKPFVSVFIRLLVKARATLYTKGPAPLHSMICQNLENRIKKMKIPMLLN